jgi:7,8-dihydro-6-hydroxymethylpterin-pyrophosphokinase
MSWLRIKLDTSQYKTELKCTRHLQIFLVSTVYSSEAVTFGWENVFINIEVPHEAVSTAVHIIQQRVCRLTNLLQRWDLQHTVTNTGHQWS